MPAKLCATQGCDMPVLVGYHHCPRHILFSERCIVPGCPRDRLQPDLTCWLHQLDDARLLEDEDTQPMAGVARERTR